VCVRYSHALLGDVVLIPVGLGVGGLFTYGAWGIREDAVQAGLLLLMALIGYGLGALRLWGTLQVDAYRVGPGGLTLQRAPFSSLRRAVSLEAAQVRAVDARKLEFMGRRGRTSVWLVEAVLRSGGLVPLGRFVEEAEARWLAATLRQALGPSQAGRGFQPPNRRGVSPASSARR
jgi:hypothetical protein